MLWDGGDESIIFERNLRTRHTPGGHDHDQSSHGNWSDGPSEGGGANLNSVSATIEKTVRSMQQFAKESQGTLRERVVVMKRDTGEVLADIEQKLEIGGNFEHVATSDSEFTNADMFDKEGNYHPDSSILHLHTHPKDQTFSDGDWRVFSRATIGEMRVVAPNGEYTLVKTEAFTALPWQERTPAAIDKAYNEHLDAVWDEATKAGKNNEEDFDGIIEETTKRMAAQFSIKYNFRELKTRDDDIAHSKTPASDLLAKNYPDDIPLDELKAQMTPEFKAAAAQAEAEMAGMQITSRRYQDANGKYVPERAELHRAIIRELFTPEAIAKATPKPGVKPVLILSGGRPAAGKTSSLKKELGNKLDTSFYINADEIQEKLPGYKGAHAGIYNGEAQDIALQAEKVARHMGLNILYDATLKSKQPALERVLNYKEAGYDVDGYFVHTTPATSVHRSAARFMSDTGRYLPPEIPYNSRTNESTFDSLIPHLRNWALYDNNGAKPKRIAGNL
jgi:predicted ABC-type ATPase